MSQQQQIIQLANMLANMPPETRVQFATQNGMPIAAVLEMEAVANELGIPLQGGSLQESGLLSEMGFESEEGGRVTIGQVAQATFDKAWSWTRTLAFYGAVPLIIYLMAARRNMTLQNFVEAVARLPFSE